jgi:hypothetical protein
MHWRLLPRACAPQGRVQTAVFANTAAQGTCCALVRTFARHTPVLLGAITLSWPDTVAIANALSVTVGSFIAFEGLAPETFLTFLALRSLEGRAPSAVKHTSGAKSAPQPYPVSSCVTGDMK